MTKFQNKRCHIYSIYLCDLVMVVDTYRSQQNLQRIQTILQKHRYLQFSIYFQKSMKFFSIVIALGLSLSQTTQKSAVECGQGLVVMASNNVCIEPNYIEGCQSYVNENECGQCNSAYKLNNKRCDYVGGLTTSQVIPGCLATDTSGKCTNCANGFRRMDGRCKPGFKNCEKYDDNGKCADCKSDYSLVLGHCRHNFLLGCRLEEADHTCKDCFSPFRKNGNHCDIPHCKSYNDFGCVGCECGYFLTAEKNCKEVTEGCIRYQRGICSNCLPHYKLKGGSCQIDGCSVYEGNKCVKCSQKYTQTADGGCEFKNCYDWLDGKCLVCMKGFRKENDECVKVNEETLKCM